jgi:tetratricopeptide (TPR) repeat protein
VGRGISGAAFASKGFAAPARSGASILPERLVVLLRESRWLAQCCIAVFVALILLSYNAADPGWSHAVAGREVHNLGGRVGAWFADLLLYLFGYSAWLLAVFLMIRVVTGYRELHPPTIAERNQSLDADSFGWDRWIGFALFATGCLAVESSRMGSQPGSLPFAPGGVVGFAFAQPILEHLGAVYLRYRECVPNAMACFFQALDCNPFSYTSWYMLGRCYAAAGRHTDAIEAYQRSLNIEPNSAETWCSLAIVYFGHAQPQEAQGALRRALRLEPKMPEAWYNLGAVCESEGQAREAHQCFLKARQFGLGDKLKLAGVELVDSRGAL